MIAQSKKWAIVGVLAVIGGLIGITMASAAGPTWSLFGNAISVIDGVGPNTGAIQLSSTCNFTGATPTCDFTTLTFSGVGFQPAGPLTFSSITQLSTDFNVGGSDCGGGSPRFQINIDTDGDGNLDGNVFVYLGPHPNFTGCFFGWQNTGNLISSTDLRYDTSQVGGTFYHDYAGALALVGPDSVLGVQLVVDGGWFIPRGQAVLVDNVTLNNHKLTQ